MLPRRGGGGEAGRGGAELPAPRRRGTASGEPSELPLERGGTGRDGRPGGGSARGGDSGALGGGGSSVVRGEIEVVVVSRERRRCERGGQVLRAEQTRLVT